MSEDFGHLIYEPRKQSERFSFSPAGHILPPLYMFAVKLYDKDKNTK